VKNSWIDVELGWEFVAEADRHPPAEALAPTAPVLLVHGAEDEVVPVEVSRAYRRDFRGKNLDFREIAGGDHRLSRHRETVGEWVDEWVRAHALARD
jgi:dipeptidyl aminopeptidase/acylaminoacyl peptidase